MSYTRSPHVNARCPHVIHTMYPCCYDLSEPKITMSETKITIQVCERILI